MITLASLHLVGKIKEVLMHLEEGDRLVEYPARIFLHSSRLESRPSVKLKPRTVKSLMMRGFICPVKEGDIFVYELTDEGQTVARAFKSQRGIIE